MLKSFISVAALALALQGGAAHAVTAVSSRGHDLTEGDLDAFFDGFMPLAVERGNVAGAVVVVVSDGRVLFEKGYGVSDETTQIPVDPKTTMFRPGSISKLFTWTAVMQLVERRKLDLARDVNAYLDFKIPPAFGKPITLHDLMTHTPGFEETDKNLFVTDPRKYVSLATALKTGLPARVFPPGEIPAYSNYGAALAGYIVQRVSGEPFELYVARHILWPLGMMHSTFVQPLPKAFAADMSEGYDKASGRPQSFELIPMSPAGALSATGDDMAHFMLAHLNNGSYGGAQILEPTTAIKMHGIAYEHTPGIPPMAYGFYHEDRNGHVIIGHGGDTLWFHSDLHLILDRNVGLFVSQNSLGTANSDLRSPLFKSFMDRYFPAPALPPEPTLKSANTDGAMVAGDYVVSRGAFTNILSILSLIAQAKVTLNHDGTLSCNIFKDYAGEPKKFREVRPFVWRERRGRELLIAKRHDGRVTEIVSDGYPQILTLQKAPMWRSRDINLPLIAFMIAMLALTVVFWPLKAVLRWRYGAAFPLEGGSAMLYRLTRIVALCDLALWGGFLGFFSYGANNHLELLSTSYDWMLRLLQAFGAVGTAGSIIAVLNAINAFRNGTGRPWWTKGTDVLLAAACVLSAWYAVTEHLLKLNLNY